MIRDFNENFREFLDSLMSNNLEALRSDNYSFYELEQYEKQCYDAAEQVLNGLPAEKKAAIEAFLEASGKIHGQKSEFLYHQGIKDTVSFLKFFKVL